MSDTPSFLDSMFDVLDDSLKEKSRTEEAASLPRRDVPQEDPFLLGDFGSAPAPSPSGSSSSPTGPTPASARSTSGEAHGDGATTNTPSAAPHCTDADADYVVRSMYDVANEGASSKAPVDEAAPQRGDGPDTKEVRLDPNASQADAVEALNAAIADGWKIDDMAPRGTDAEQHIVITLKRSRPPSLFDFG